jgi:2-iminobutanoate/2-iminopropanoate deaminase
MQEPKGAHDMPLRQITSPKLAEPPGGIYSNCIVVGNQVFLAGMTATPTDGSPAPNDMVAQARLCFERIRIMLEAAGASMGDIVKMTIYVTDIGKRAEFSVARKEAFSGVFPCSTLVEVKGLVTPDLLVEIDATAIIGAHV